MSKGGSAGAHTSFLSWGASRVNLALVFVGFVSVLLLLPLLLTHTIHNSHCCLRYLSATHKYMSHLGIQTNKWCSCFSSSAGIKQPSVQIKTGIIAGKQTREQWLNHVLSGTHRLWCYVCLLITWHWVNPLIKQVRHAVSEYGDTNQFTWNSRRGSPTWSRWLASE